MIPIADMYACHLHLIRPGIIGLTTFSGVEFSFVMMKPDAQGNIRVLPLTSSSPGQITPFETVAYGQLGGLECLSVPRAQVHLQSLGKPKFGGSKCDKGDLVLIGNERFLLGSSLKFGQLLVSLKDGSARTIADDDSVVSFSDWAVTVPDRDGSADVIAILQKPHGVTAAIL